MTAPRWFEPLQLWTRRPLVASEESQPWLTYRFLHTDAWTRITGRSSVRMQCGVCGAVEVARLRIPRFGPVPEPVAGRHPRRLAFMGRHLHQLGQP